MVSTGDHGLSWTPCGHSATAPLTPCPTGFGGAGGFGRCAAATTCLPITHQVNFTHPNTRSVTVGPDGEIFVTLWDEGFLPCHAGQVFVHDPNLTHFSGGAFVSKDGGATFRSLFRDPKTHQPIFDGAVLRCKAKPSAYMSSNFPYLEVDPADSGHVLMAGWGQGQGLLELDGGKWTSWGTCDSTIDTSGCFDGDRVDSLALDSNQYAFSFRVVEWRSNQTVVMTHGNATNRSRASTAARPEVLITDSRGALHGLWDPVHARFAFLHLNDRYTGVKEAGMLGCVVKLVSLVFRPPP